MPESNNPESSIPKGLTHIGACVLPIGPNDDDPRGHWIHATCDAYQRAIASAGGTENLSVWSTLTDPDGQYGSPFIFTCWGSKHADGNPVAADGGHPSARWSRGKPCAMTHAVFIPAFTPHFTSIAKED